MQESIDRNYLIKLSDESGAILKDSFYSHKNVKSKGKKGFVTDTDIAINDYFIDILSNIGFSSDEILTEEKENCAVKSDHHRIWIIDPLDGTREFVHQIPEVAVSIYYADQKGCAAALINPMQDFQVVADDAIGLKNLSTKDQTLFLNTIVGSRSEQKKGLMSKLENEAEVAWVGSIAYKLGLVAAGYAKSTISYRPKNVWDIAAGFYLVEKSGGQVTDLAGKRFDFRNDPHQKIFGGIVATRASENHDEILALANACLIDKSSLFD